MSYKTIGLILLVLPMLSLFCGAMMGLSEKVIMVIVLFGVVNMAIGCFCLMADD